MYEATYGWEVSDIDISVALERLGLPITDEQIDEVMSFLNRNEVENEALMTDEMDDQYENSIKNIMKQIKEHRGEA